MNGRTNRKLNIKLTRQLLTIGLVLLCSAVMASAIPGRAEVKKVVGSATVAKAVGGSTSITEGMVLGTGDTITTGPASTVDLWLGLNGDALRIDPDTTLKIEALEIANISERRVTTGLTLAKGGVVGNVMTKLTAASKYEIKTAAGVAGIRGTIYAITSGGALIVAQGRVDFTFINAQGQSVTVAVPAGSQVITTGANVGTVSVVPGSVLAAITTTGTQIALTTTGTDGTSTSTTTLAATVTNPLNTSVSAPAPPVPPVPGPGKQK